MALSLLVCLACRQRPSVERWSGVIDTLSNGAVHVRNPSTGFWSHSQGWQLALDLVIGAAVGTEVEHFGVVYDLDVDARGRIYVLDGQLQEIRVFDNAGRYVRTIGRQGAGPGEFRNAIGMDWDSTGRLWVVDVANSRYSVFDTAGQYLASYPRSTGRGLTVIPWPGGFDSADRLYDIAGWPGRPLDPLLVRVDPARGRYDTLSLPIVPPAKPAAFRDGSGLERAPSLSRVIWALDRQARVWSARTDQYRIVAQTSAGDTVRIIERAYRPERRSDRERQAAAERLSAPSERADRPRRIPELKEALTGLEIDPEGYVWARRTTVWEEGGEAFDLFDPTGRYLGIVETNLKFTWPLVVRNGALYGVSLDRDGVPRVLRARVLKRGKDLRLDSI